jgi:hypothetical protein
MAAMTDHSAPRCRKTKRASIATQARWIAATRGELPCRLSRADHRLAALDDAPFSGAVFLSTPHFGARFHGLVACAQKKQ